MYLDDTSNIINATANKTTINNFNKRQTPSSNGTRATPFWIVVGGGLIGLSVSIYFMANALHQLRDSFVGQTSFTTTTTTTNNNNNNTNTNSNDNNQQLIKLTNQQTNEDKESLFLSMPLLSRTKRDAPYWSPWLSNGASSFSGERLGQRKQLSNAHNKISSSLISAKTNSQTNPSKQFFRRSSSPIESALAAVSQTVSSPPHQLSSLDTTTAISILANSLNMSIPRIYPPAYTTFTGQINNNSNGGGQQDLMLESSSSYGNRYDSLSSTGSGISNYNNQWRPLPDHNDHNGPILPVQVDLIEGFYQPSLVGSPKHKGPRMMGGRQNTINLNKQLNQQASGPLKVFKRVLVSDKTIVSMDFTRNNNNKEKQQQQQQQNMKSPIDNINHSSLYSGVDSNMIDLEALNIMNNDENYLAKARSSSAHSSYPTIYAAPAIKKSFNTNSGRNFQNTNNLVACDMWDLEKGQSNRKPPSDIVRMAVQTDFQTIRNAINKCRMLTEKFLHPIEVDNGLDLTQDDVASIFSVKRGLIPGTKWCGIGDSADSYNDLGTKKRIDICCRAHDHCPVRLKPFRQGYGLINIAIYTKSHCDCDEDFYRCLKGSRSRVADFIGNIYFNVLKLQCLHAERLKLCTEMKKGPLGFEKCVRWEDSSDRSAFKFTYPPVAY